jgi:hypothetical protein
MTPKFVFLMICLMSFSFLVSCGKAGAPLTPKESLYPLFYPAPEAKNKETIKANRPKAEGSDPSKSYVDPSVEHIEATKLYQVQPGSNLPYFRLENKPSLDESVLPTSRQSPLTDRPDQFVVAPEEDSQPGQAIDPQAQETEK